MRERESAEEHGFTGKCFPVPGVEVLSSEAITHAAHPNRGTCLPNPSDCLKCRRTKGLNIPRRTITDSARLF